MSLRLILVRHGLSSFNKEGRIQGRNDLSVLTEEGRLQALKAGKALSKVPIDAIYSSPLKRASETTKIIIQEQTKAIEPEYTDDLLEIDLGPWSGLTKNELKKNFPKELEVWDKEPKELVITREDGTSYKPITELTNQVEHFLEKLFKSHTSSNNSEKTILLVAHNAILKCLLLKLLGEPTNGFRRIKLDNTSISIVNINLNKFNRFQPQIECLNNITHLDTALPKKNSGARVILVRHGETDWNNQGRFQGQIDIPLNDNGKLQAASAGFFLSNVSLQKAYSSSMSRPLETAKIILESHSIKNIKTNKNLIEIGHGLWEGKLESEIKSTWPELLEDWKLSPEKVQMPEGENIQEVSKRALKAWDEICSELEKKDTALIVAHDAVNKVILCNLLGLSPADIWIIKQGNGGITIIDLPTTKNQVAIVSCLNITSHLGGILDKTAEGAL